MRGTSDINMSGEASPSECPNGCREPVELSDDCEVDEGTCSKAEMDSTSDLDALNKVSKDLSCILERSTSESKPLSNGLSDDSLKSSKCCEITSCEVSTSSNRETYSDEPAIVIDKEDYPPEFHEGYYDVGIFFSEDDEEEVQRFVSLLEKCVEIGEKKRKVAVCVLGSMAHIRYKNSKFSQLTEVLERCTYKMFFLTENFNVEFNSWDEMQRDVVLQDAIDNRRKKDCIIPVYARPREKKIKIPTCLGCLKGIKLPQLLKKVPKDIDDEKIDRSHLDKYMLACIEETLSVRAGVKTKGEAKLQIELDRWKEKEIHRRRQDEKEEKKRLVIERAERAREAELLEEKRQEEVSKAEDRIKAMHLDSEAVKQYGSRSERYHHDEGISTGYASPRNCTRQPVLTAGEQNQPNDNGKTSIVYNLNIYNEGQVDNISINSDRPAREDVTSHDQDGASGEDGENNTEVEYVVEEIDSPGCIFDSDTSPPDVYQLPVISGPHISQQTAHSQPATLPQHNSQQTPHHLPVHDVPPHFKAPPPAHRNESGFVYKTEPKKPENDTRRKPVEGMMGTFHPTLPGSMAPDEPYSEPNMEDVTPQGNTSSRVEVQNVTPSPRVESQNPTLPRVNVHTALRSTSQDGSTQVSDEKLHSIESKAPAKTLDDEETTPYLYQREIPFNSNSRVIYPRGVDMREGETCSMTSSYLENNFADESTKKVVKQVSIPSVMDETQMTSIREAGHLNQLEHQNYNLPQQQRFIRHPESHQRELHPAHPDYQQLPSTQNQSRPLDQQGYSYTQRQQSTRPRTSNYQQQTIMRPPYLSPGQPAMSARPQYMSAGQPATFARPPYLSPGQPAMSDNDHQKAPHIPPNARQQLPCVPYQPQNCQQHANNRPVVPAGYYEKHEIPGSSNIQQQRPCMPSNFEQYYDHNQSVRPPSTQPQHLPAPPSEQHRTSTVPGHYVTQEYYDPRYYTQSYYEQYEQELPDNPAPTQSLNPTALNYLAEAYNPGQYGGAVDYNSVSESSYVKPRAEHVPDPHMSMYDTRGPVAHRGPYYPPYQSQGFYQQTHGICNDRMQLPQHRGMRQTMEPTAYPYEHGLTEAGSSLPHSHSTGELIHHTGQYSDAQTQRMGELRDPRDHRQALAGHGHSTGELRDQAQPLARHPLPHRMTVMGQSTPVPQPMLQLRTPHSPPHDTSNDDVEVDTPL